MTSKDKTGDKLVASVRKSKTGTVAQKTSERQNAGKQAAKSNAPTARSESTARPASKAATNQDRKDSYSLGRRVWPD
ncbi:hypothetical protein [Kaarinaea lacus]